MTEELRYSMTAAALEIGRKLGYVGAGTVEFILVCCIMGILYMLPASNMDAFVGCKDQKVLLFGGEYSLASRARYYRSYIWFGSC
jgi:hypothetical protein